MGRHKKDEDWEPHKDKIKAFYLDDNKTLEETMKCMASPDVGFKATKPQYRRMLGIWGFEKNVRQHEWYSAISIVKKRKREGKDTELAIGDRKIAARRLKKRMCRPDVKLGDVASSASLGDITQKSASIVASTPPSTCFAGSQEICSLSILTDGGAHFLGPNLPFSLAWSSIIPTLVDRDASPRDNGLILQGEPLPTVIISRCNPRFPWLSSTRIDTRTLHLPSTLLRSFLDQERPSVSHQQQIMQTHPLLYLLQTLLYLISNNLLPQQQVDTIVDWLDSSAYLPALQHMAKIQTPSVDEFSARLLTSAIDCNKSNVARALLDAGLSVRDSYRQSRRSASPLSVALAKGHWAVIQVLLSSGLNLNYGKDSEICFFSSIRECLYHNMKYSETGPSELEAIVDTVEVLLNVGLRPKQSETLEEICVWAREFECSRLLHALQQAGISHPASDVSNTMASVTDAVSKAYSALRSASGAMYEAHEAVSKASKIVSERSHAISEASDAISGASNAVSKTPEAFFKAFNAASKASNAISKAFDATTEASNGIFRASDGIFKASISISEAVDSIFTASTTFFKMSYAMSKASNAMSEAFDTVSEVSRAISKASDAIYKALGTTSEASPYVFSVYTHPPGWSNLSDSAKKKSFWTMRLLAAIESRHVNRALMMVDCGADIDGADPEGSGHGRPIKIAIMNGLTGLVESLLDLGADSNALIHDQVCSRVKNLDEDDFTPRRSGALHCAAFMGKHDMVTLLLKAGADACAIDNYGWSPLHWLMWGALVRPSTLEIAKTLLDYGADPNGRTHDPRQQTALKMLPTHEFDWTKVGDLLVDHGAEIPWLVESPDSEFLTSLGKWPEGDGIIHFCRKHSRHLVGQESQASPFTAWLDKCLDTAMDHRNISALFVLLVEGADASKVMGPPWDRDEHHSDIRRDVALHGLQNGPDISSWPHGCKYHTFPSLQIAILHQDLEEASLLLSRGARVDHFPRWGMFSPLHIAAAAEPAYDYWGQPKNGDDGEELVKMLIAAGADIHAYEMSTFCSSHSHNWQNPESLNVDLPGAIVKIGEDLRRGDLTISAFIATPMQVAAFQRSSATVEILHEAGAAINAPPAEKYGFTALQVAVSQGRKQTMQYLLTAGADINAPSATEVGFTALQCSILKRDAVLTNKLIRLEADIHAPAARRIGCTALQAAIMTGDKRLAFSLLASGVDVNATSGSEYGYTALQAACEKDAADVVEMLLQHEADVNAPPCRVRGATALQYAVLRGNLDIVIKLLERGADICAPGAQDDGRTALEAAAEYGRLDIAHLLLQRYPDPLSLGDDCTKAAKFADKERHRVVAKLLRGGYASTHPAFCPS